MNEEEQKKRKWKLTPRKESLPAGMDPYLYRLLQKTKKMQKQTPAAEIDGTTDTLPWIEIIVELDDPNIEVPGLEDFSLQGNIATGKIHYLDIEPLLANNNVLALSAARPIGPATKKSPRSELESDDKTAQETLPDSTKDESPPQPQNSEELPYSDDS
jgi:hypothetical protein